jgi:ubiquinone/menaquinone biosynthesis C-methylase UbiE
MIDAQRFARMVTDAVVRRPLLWRLFRRPLRSMFDGLAPTWETRIGPHHLWALDLALEDVAPVPRRILDLGTGTGVVAIALAERYPDAEVVGIDISTGMIDEARRKVSPELGNRVAFEVGDAAALAFPDNAFDLVVLSNMIPFVDELARVVAPGGTLVLSSSRGGETPIYVPPERLRRELEPRGFAEFAEFSAAPATAVRARRR